MQISFTKHITFLCAICAIFSSLFAQNDDNFKHFGFGVGSGITFANKYVADYYSGSEDNVNKISYILNNPYRINEIRDELNGRDFTLYQHAMDMKYKMSAPIAVRVFYRFDEENRIFLEVNQWFLKAAGIFTLLIDSVTFNAEPPLEKCSIWGDESRTMLDLGYRYNFTTRSFYDIFLEAGASFAATVVTANEIKIRDYQASIMDRGNYTPGQPQYDPMRQQGLGVGLFANLGVEIWAAKIVSVDIGFSLRFMDVNLGDYKKFKGNYGFFVKVNLMSF
jgi:hypothetical protein